MRAGVIVGCNCSRVGTGEIRPKRIHVEIVQAFELPAALCAVFLYRLLKCRRHIRMSWDLYKVVADVVKTASLTSARIFLPFLA